MSSSDNPYKPYTPPRSEKRFAASASPDNDEAPIVATGVISVAEYLEAVRLARGFGNRTVVRLALLVSALFALYGTALTYTVLRRGTLSRHYLILIGCFFPAFFFGYSYVRLRHRLNRMWTEKRSVFAPQEYTYTDKLIRFRAPYWEGTMQWRAFSGYRASKNLAVLFRDDPRMFNVAARSRFESESEWNRFLKLLHRKLPRI